MDKERSAIANYTEELSLEAQEFDGGFVAADSEAQACDALLDCFRRSRGAKAWSKRWRATFNPSFQAAMASRRKTCG